MESTPTVVWYFHIVEVVTESTEMDSYSKADLRDMPAQRTVEYEAQEQVIGAWPADAECYAQALKQIEPEITKGLRQVLIGHAVAPRQTLSMSQIAQLAGGGLQFCQSLLPHTGPASDRGIGRVRLKWWIYKLTTFDDLLSGT